MELLAQYIGFLIGGSDSTARLMQFALYHIAKLPDVQGRLQEEIDAVVDESVRRYSHSAFTLLSKSAVFLDCLGFVLNCEGALFEMENCLNSEFVNLNLGTYTQKLWV